MMHATIVDEKVYGNVGKKPHGRGKMGSMSEWFKRNWLVFAVLAIAGASVVFFYWILTMQVPTPPYP